MSIIGKIGTGRIGRGSFNGLRAGSAAVIGMKGTGYNMPQRFVSTSLSPTRLPSLSESAKMGSRISSRDLRTGLRRSSHSNLRKLF